MATLPLAIIYFGILLLKILGIPGIKDIPWSMFLIIPLIWVTLKVLWPVFKVVGVTVMGIFMIEAVLWIFLPAYHIQIWGILGGFFSAAGNALYHLIV